MARHFILFCCSVPLALAQQSHQNQVSGRVLDSQGGTVAAAEVRLYSRDSAFQRSTRSSAAGSYQFTGLSDGEFMIEARTDGLDQASPERVTLHGTEATVDLRLRVAELSTRVTVTSSATALSTAEVGKGTDVLDMTELGRRAEFSVTEALRNIAGVRVQQLGGPGSFTRILTRGLRATDTSILIDGMRLRDTAAVQGDATAYIGDLLLIDSDRIEVLRGSGSSIYGTHAMSGVVNVVTDSGGGPIHGELGGEGGGLGLGRGLAKMAGGALDDRVQYSGGVTHLNVSGGVDGIENVRNWSGQGFAQYRFTPRAKLSARIWGTTAMVGLTTNPEATGDLPPEGTVPAVPYVTFIPNQFDPDSRRVGDFLSGMTTWTHQVSPRVTYRIAYQAVSSDRSNLNGPAGPGYQSPYNTADTFQGRSDTIQARADIAAGRGNMLSAGYEFERETYDNITQDQNPIPVLQVNASTTAAQRSNTAFIQDQFRGFNDRLIVSLSGRIQGFTMERPTFTGDAPPYTGATFEAPPRAVTGDASIAYLIPSSGTKLRAHTGNAYRAPALYERFGAYYFLGSFTAIGDPRLSPERSIGVDGGIDQYFASNKLRVSASYFYSRLQEVIGFGGLTDDPFGRFAGYVNVGGGLARGVELSGEARPWRTMLIEGSYTYTNADNRKSDLIGGSLQAIRVFPHMVTIVASQQIGRRWQVTADFLGASSYIAGTFFVGSGNRPFLFPGPRRLDTAIQYDLPVGEAKSLRFFTRIENVLNRDYYEDGFRTPKAWASAGVRWLF